MALEKPMITLDFDGVVHSYTSGWQGATEIPDLPVDGAQAFIEAALKQFRISIYSQRSQQKGGIIAMKQWFAYRMNEDIAAALSFPTEKPLCLVTIDDRVIQFQGYWPKLDDIANFKSWLDW